MHRCVFHTAGGLGEAALCPFSYCHCATYFCLVRGGLLFSFYCFPFSEVGCCVVFLLSELSKGEASHFMHFPSHCGAAQRGPAGPRRAPRVAKFLYGMVEARKISDLLNWGHNPHQLSRPTEPAAPAPVAASAPAAAFSASVLAHASMQSPGTSIAAAAAAAPPPPPPSAFATAAAPSAAPTAALAPALPPVAAVPSATPPAAVG